MVRQPKKYVQNDRIWNPIEERWEPRSGNRREKETAIPENFDLGDQLQNWTDGVKEKWVKGVKEKNVELFQSSKKEDVDLDGDEDEDEDEDDARKTPLAIAISLIVLATAGVKVLRMIIEGIFGL